jgi:hypothetical protein
MKYQTFSEWLADTTGVKAAPATAPLRPSATPRTEMGRLDR